MLGEIQDKKQAFLPGRKRNHTEEGHEEGTLKENPSYEASKDTQASHLRGSCVQHLRVIEAPWERILKKKIMVST